jgi:hypothetical protein
MISLYDNGDRCFPVRSAVVQAFSPGISGLRFPQLTTFRLDSFFSSSPLAPLWESVRVRVTDPHASVGVEEHRISE